MENTVEKDILKLDSSVVIKEAENEVRAISDTEKKISAYYNVLVTEAFKQYLDDNDIVNCETVNLRSSTKFLSEFETSDIQLPNLSIYVRAVYDEELLFVPKRHFENKITPNIYLFIKVDEELKTGEILGYVKPDNINTKNSNGKYYFVNKSFLKPLSELISLIKNLPVKEQYIISDKTEETIEKFILLYLDNDIDSTKLDKLIDYFKNSSVAREKLIEFENFERLSFMSLQEFKDLDVENNDFTKYIRTLFPVDEFTNFTQNKEMIEDENTTNKGGLFIDDDLIKSEEKNEENVSQQLEEMRINDEFDVFEEDSDFSDISEEDLELTEENITVDETPQADEINKEVDDMKEENVLPEIGDEIEEFKDDKIDETSDIDIENDENITVPDDLNLNILDDVNETGNGLDTETVIGLTEDVLYEGEDVQEKSEINLEEEPSEINEFDELNMVTNEEIDMAISESKNGIQEDIEPAITDESSDFGTVKIDEETSETPEISDKSAEETPSEVQEKVDNEEQMPALMQDEDDDEGMISLTENDTKDYSQDIVTDETIHDEIIDEQNNNGNNADLNEIYNETTSEPMPEISEVLSEAPSDNFEYQGTNFAFATDKGVPASQKITAAIAASVLILCLGGFGAWYFMNHGKSTPVANIDTDNSKKADLTDFSLDDIKTTNTTVSNENKFETDKENKADKDVVANLNIPAKAPNVKNNKTSEQLTIQKIKKDFSKPDTYVSVSKIVWDVPEYLTYNDDFNTYLQTVGSSLKVNLSSDLLLISENPILNNVKLKVSIKDSGKNFTVDVTQGCGVQNIDSLVLQSVKKTMNILKPPVNSLDTADEDLYLTICL